MWSRAISRRHLHQRDLVPGREISVLEVDEVTKTLRVRAGSR